MREILFRGKRTDNGEWVYGSIISFDDNRKAIMPSRAKVFKKQGTTTICCNECYDVDSTTVGQFTGLNDRNGTRIFEGDIVEHTTFHSDDKIRTGLYCSDCGAWIKWLSKDEIRTFEHEKIKTSEPFHHDEWISCRERLPESDEPEVLCLVTYQDYNVFESKWENSKLGIMSYLTEHQIWNTKALVKVLAWMPLPEPFKLMEWQEND